MKTPLSPILSVLVLTLTGCDIKSEKVESEASQEVAIKPQRGELSAEDLGIYKYVFASKTPKGKVMVLRWTKLIPGKEAKVRDLIYFNADGNEVREVIILHDPKRFPFNPEPEKPVRMLVKMGGEQFHLPAGVHAHFVFSREEPCALYLSNQERWTFHCFLEDYQSVKARLPDLPPMPGTGGWGGFKSETFHGVMD